MNHPPTARHMPEYLARIEARLADGFTQLNGCTPPEPLWDACFITVEEDGILGMFTVCATFRSPIPVAERGLSTYMMALQALITCVVEAAGFNQQATPEVLFLTNNTTHWKAHFKA